LNFSNGTTVDGNPIIFAQVEEGQVIKFGNASCTFQVKESSPDLTLNYENVMKTSLIPKNLLTQAKSRSQLLRPGQSSLTPEIAPATENPRPPAKPRKTRPLGMAPQNG